MYYAIWNHKEILKRCDQAAGDKSYDDEKLIDKLWGDWQIKPVIDIRNLWKDGEKTKVVKGARNVVYNLQ